MMPPCCLWLFYAATLSATRCLTLFFFSLCRALAAALLLLALPRCHLRRRHWCRHFLLHAFSLYFDAAFAIFFIFARCCCFSLALSMPFLWWSSCWFRCRFAFAVHFSLLMPLSPVADAEIICLRHAVCLMLYYALRHAYQCQDYALLWLIFILIFIFTFIYITFWALYLPSRLLLFSAFRHWLLMISSLPFCRHFSLCIYFLLEAIDIDALFIIYWCWYLMPLFCSYYLLFADALLMPLIIFICDWRLFFLRLPWCHARMRVARYLPRCYAIAISFIFGAFFRHLFIISMIFHFLMLILFV